MAGGHHRVGLQVAPDLLGDQREHLPGLMLACHEHRHAAQRLRLPQAGAQFALEALILDYELRGTRIAHRLIVPRTRGAR
jgi:hypothetical protein